MPPYFVIEEMSSQHDFCMDEDVVKEVARQQQQEHLHSDIRDGLSDDEKTLGTADTTESDSVQALGIVHTGDSEDSAVKFDLGNVMVHSCLGRHEMTETYFRDVWYRSADFASISTWNRMTVKVFRQHEKEFGQECMDLGEHCIRGLEHRLKGRNEERREMTVNAIYAVLGEQARSRREGKPATVEDLAKIYSEHNRVAVAAALEKAKKDAESAMDLPEEKDDSKNAATGKRPVHRRRSGLDFSNHKSFDDCDVNSLREDVTAVPVTTPGATAATTSSPGFDEDIFRNKAKREKSGSISFSRFFKKKSSKSSSKEQQQHKTAAATSGTSPKNDMLRRRRYRRSSM